MSKSLLSCRCGAAVLGYSTGMSVLGEDIDTDSDNVALFLELVTL